MNKKWKKVSIPQCFLTIFISAICLLAFVVPYSIQPLVFTYSKISIAEGSLINDIALIVESGLPKVIAQADNYMYYIILGYKASIFTFLGVIALNVFCSLLLILTRSGTLRKIFKFFSVLFGIALLVVAILYVAYLVAVYGYTSVNGLNISQILNETYALFALGMIIFSIVLGLKQFEFFSAPF